MVTSHPPQQNPFRICLPFLQACRIGCVRSPPGAPLGCPPGLVADPGGGPLPPCRATPSPMPYSPEWSVWLSLLCSFDLKRVHPRFGVLPSLPVAYGPSRGTDPLACLSPWGFPFRQCTPYSRSVSPRSIIPNSHRPFQLLLGKIPHASPLICMPWRPLYGERSLPPAAAC